MRRIFLTVAATTALLAITPGLALAHRHHRRHHRSHHVERVHHRRSRHHSRIRHERFGSKSWSEPGDSQGTAGMVTSFNDGVLTITLNDGSTVSGKVTDSTELECTTPSSSSSQGDDGDKGGGDSGDDDGGDNGNDQGEDQGDGGQMCDTSSLINGTPVAEASLEITSGGATWEKVELVTS